MGGSRLLVNRSAPSLKAVLKRLRAMPAINAPVAHAVRGTARMLGVTPEFAIRHLPRSGVTRMTLPGGREARLWSRGDDWVSNQVFWRGWDGYDPEVAPLFWRLATRARVTLDIGAFVGYYSVLAGLANPEATVLAFEPLPGVFERLERNIRLNRLHNVVALQRAAGAIDGHAEFFHVPGIIPSSSSLSEAFMGGTAGLTAVPVSVARIETVLRERGVTGVDLVKLDTETTEPDVLAGFGRMLAASRPDIICEVLTRADVEALTAILQPLHYRFYLLTGDGPQPRERIAPDGRWLNYFFTIGPVGDQ
jgi:FkbM family methyltransferase